MSTQICNPCAEGQICLDNLDRYSLQDDVYYFVLNCPPNFFCGGNNTMYLVCCDGTIEQTTFTAGMTAAQRQAAISALVSSCLMKDAFCTGTDTDPNNGDGTNGRPGNTPNDPLQLYGNRPMSSTSYCADGSPFTYTVPAGLFFARTQAAADAAARNFARTLSGSLKICLTGPLRTCCNNTAYSSTMVASGGVPGDFRWSVSGSLPTGLVAIPFGNNGLRIQGIPTTNGNYTFTVRATDSAGNFMSKVITIKVWGITDTTLPDGTLAANYDYQLTTTNGTAPYVYTLVGGGFPLGVDITSGGLITGVVGEIGTFSPEIKVTDHQGKTCTKTFTLECLSGCPTMPILNYTLPAVAGFDTGPWDNYKAWFIEYPSSARLDAGNKVLVCGRSQLSPYRPHGLTLYDFTTNPATLVQYIDGPGLYNNVMSQFMVCPDNRKVVGLINHKDSAVGAITYEYFFLDQTGLTLTYLSEIVPQTYYMPVYVTGETNRIAFLKGSGGTNMIDIVHVDTETLEQIPGPAVDLRIYYGGAFCCEENVFLFSAAAGLTKVSRVDGSVVDTFPVSGDRLAYSNVQNEIWMFDQTNAYVYSIGGTLLATLPYTETLFLTGNVKGIYNEKLNCAAIVGYEIGTGDFVHVAYVYDCATRTLKQKITLATYAFGGFRPREIVPNASTSGYMYTVDEDGIWREIIPTII